MVEKRFKGLLLYIIFIMIIIISPSAYALEVDVTNSVTSPETSGQGKYRGTEILNTGAQATYNVKTRYQGRLSRIIYNLPLPSELGTCFTTNATYTITMYMETNDWNNKFGSVKVRPYSSSTTNWSSGSVTYVSYKKIYFTFKIPSSDTTCYDFVWVDLPSTNISNTGITQISNWNLNKITLTDPTISSGGSGGTSPTPTPNTTQQIIDNQNENTQNIIDNQNENTQNIIENNNSSTESLNESINDNCKNTNLVLSNELGISSGKYLNTSGSEVSYSGANITRDIKLRPNTEYHLKKLTGGSTPSGMGFCLYNVNGSLSRCLEYPNIDQFNLSFTPTNYEVYGKFTMYSYRVFELDGYICNDWEREGLQNIADSINNSNVDNGVGSNFFNDFDSDDNGGISAIVTKPLMIVNNLLSNNGQCSNLTLPEFLGVSNAYLPSGCILWDNASTTMINLWNIFVCGLGSYFILKDIFRIIENLKNPDNDKVEVMDL